MEKEYSESFIEQLYEEKIVLARNKKNEILNSQNIFDFNTIETMFIYLFISYDRVKKFRKRFLFCNTFGLVSKLFNQVSNQTKFGYILFEKEININYKLYLKLYFINQKLPYEPQKLESNINGILQYSSKHGYYDLIDILMDNGADINNPYSMDIHPLILSCKSGLAKTTKKLISNGANVNFPDCQGYTALMFATHSRKFKLVKLLIKNGANIATKNIFGETAFIMSLHFGNLDVIKYFIEHPSSDLNLPYNSNQETATMYSIRYSPHVIIKFLIENHFLNLNLKNSENRNGLDLAIESRDETIIDLIQKEYSKQNIET